MMPGIKHIAWLVLIFFLLSACSLQPEPTLLAVETEPDTSVVTGQSPTPTGIPTSEPTPTVTQTDECLNCHSDKQNLIDSATPEGQQSTSFPGLDWAGKLPVLESWEKVFVDAENFIPTVHGKFPCTSCHGGSQSSDKEVAHTGLNPNPSQGPEVVCGECHPDIAHVFENSLHATVQGFSTIINQRSMPSKHVGIEEMLDTNCVSCHNTCGDCHVSQPRSVGGGLYDGHLFQRTPPMDRSCNACHGTRIGNEFLGYNNGLPADIHYLEGGMECTNCHMSNELHGDPAGCNTCHPGPESVSLPLPDHRYDGIQAPSCESCHTPVTTGEDGVIMHQMHGADLSCQVCHSIAYTNCEGCHVGVDKGTGNAIHELDASYNTFLIGRNPIQTYERPYRFVPVRHVPVSPDSFDYIGSNLLPNFSNVETWKYTTPHNIQLDTPQNRTCNACHGNPELFLTADKVAAEELDANQNVILETIPPPITSANQIP